VNDKKDQIQNDQKLPDKYLVLCETLDIEPETQIKANGESPLSLLNSVIERMNDVLPKEKNLDAANEQEFNESMVFLMDKFLIEGVARYSLDPA
jgi:hypothetical protein